MRWRRIETFLQIFWPIAIAFIFNVIMVLMKGFEVDGSFLKYLGETLVQMSILPLMTGNIMLFPVKQFVSEKETGI
jgi:hypothetical protein